MRGSTPLYILALVAAGYGFYKHDTNYLVYSVTAAVFYLAEVIKEQSKKEKKSCSNASCTGC